MAASDNRDLHLLAFVPDLVKKLLLYSATAWSIKTAGFLRYKMLSLSDSLSGKFWSKPGCLQTVWDFPDCALTGEGDKDPLKLLQLDWLFVLIPFPKKETLVIKSWC